MTTRIARLTDRACIRVKGSDALPFLHNLLTQDVAALMPGELRFGALLSPPGRLLFDLFILGVGEGDTLLDVAADRRGALIQRLSMYKLRANVTVEADDATVVSTAWGDDIGDGFIDPRLPELGRRLYASPPTHDDGLDAFHAHRLSLGVPDPAADGGFDKRYPIEANFDLLNGIDFAKGCFIGQETTSRMKRRGSIKNRMMTITFDGPPPPEGAEVLNGDLRAGEVLTGRDGRAMALLRLDRLEGQLTVDGRPVQAEVPAWISLQTTP